MRRSFRVVELPRAPFLARKRDMGGGGLLQVAWSRRVGDYATAVTASHQGELVAVGTSSGEIHVFDSSTGASRFTALAHAGGVSGAAFSPRARVLATTGQDGYATLYDAAGRALSVMPTGAGSAGAVSWAPHGRSFATSSGPVLRVWSNAGSPVFEAAPAERPITGMSWNRSGSQLAIAGEGGVRILHGRSGKQLRHLPWPRPLGALAWSPDDAVIACATMEASVHFWRLESRKGSQISGYTTEPRALAWGAGGALLATGGAAVVSVWPFDGGGPEGKRPTLLAGHEALCTALAFHPQGWLLATGGDDASVRLWDPRAEAAPLLGRGQLAETITGVAWAGRRGGLLIAIDAEGSVRAWSVTSLR